ncbi:MAG: PocR ligand-binding domain-containing protein [Candidatus Pacebacteria bacterium]|nr:PocR ligand-binding domain-containing protein [Candidatus Paceibacterota bacterium]
MANKKPLSEAAKWFLQEFENLLQDFSKEMQVYIIMADKYGNLITKILGPEKACNIINSVEEGRVRYEDSCKPAISLVAQEKKPVFIDSFAGFACVWIPIIVRNAVIGVIISCGGRYDIGETRQELEKKYSKLADELGIMDKQGFLKACIDETKIVTKQEVVQRAERLTKLVHILSETTLTPLKEVFG